MTITQDSVNSFKGYLTECRDFSEYFFDPLHDVSRAVIISIIFSDEGTH